MKPLIGITAYYVRNEEFNEEDRIRGTPGQDMLMCSGDNFQFIKEAGGIPVIISSINEKNYIENVLKRCEGIILTGGGDIHPHIYNEKRQKSCKLVNIYRDKFEMNVLQMAVNTGTPIFGICRGMQLINVFFGGTIHQNLDSAITDIDHFQKEKARDYLAHEVKIKPGSHLSKALNQNHLRTNSIHHQAVNILGNDISVSAEAPDGIVEGLEHNKHALFGVQWHPEMIFRDNRIQLQILNYFLTELIKQ